MARRIEELIRNLDLREHPEGGFYRRTYRSPHMLPAQCLPQGFPGPRPLGSAIVYLLKSRQMSALHRIKSDELWHFYEGSPLTIYMIDEDGAKIERKLGADTDRRESFQVLVPAGCWFGALVNRPDSYSLVGCTVYPAFDLQDFELGDRGTLITLFPQHRTLIELLTHDPTS